MAAEGMLFSKAYSQPLSAPTRVQLMTGKYNFRNYEGFGVMSPDEVTFGDLLKDAGYITGITGKWQQHGNAVQMKLAGKEGCMPQEVGFDHYFVWHTTFPHLALPPKDSIDIKVLGYAETTQRESRYKDPVIMTENGKLTFHDKYGPDLFLDWAEDFIEENKNKEKPFFLYYPMVLVHDPFQATPKNKNYKDSKPTDKSDPKYFGEMMSYMDDMVGKIIKKVNDEGIADNTLIIFTGDNGTNTKIVSEWNNQQIRGDKGAPREWGIHVPFVAYWKNHIIAGQVNNNMIDFSDVLPTLMQVANSELPKDYVCDGLSFYDQMLGKADARKRESSFGYYDPQWALFKKAVWIQDATSSWKLYQSGEYYNLKNDPEEQHPLTDKELSRSEKKIKDKLSKEMSEILKR